MNATSLRTSLKQRLRAQLKPGGSGWSRRSYDVDRTAPREKGALRSVSIALTLLAGSALTGLVYAAASYMGWLATPDVERLNDPRWGARYNRRETPITAMTLDDSRIYAGTAGNGLHIFDRRTGLWETYRRGSDGRMPDDRIRWLKRDEAHPGALWALTEHGGTGFASDATDWNIVSGATPFSGLGADTIITAARNGAYIAAGTRNSGMGLYDLSRRTWISGEQIDVKSRRIHAIRSGARPGSFWIAMSDGVAQIENGKLTKNHIPDSTLIAVTDIERDDNGLWFLTAQDNAVGRITPDGSPVLFSRNRPLPFPVDEITGVAQNDRIVWIGSRRHGVYRCDLSRHIWTSVLLSESEISVTALAFNPDAGTLLVGAREGLFTVRETGVDSPPDTGFYDAFQGITRFVMNGSKTYFLTENGRLGMRSEEKQTLMAEWWNVLKSPEERRKTGVSVLVDASVVHIDPANISAACQSDEALYLGTPDGDIVWYNLSTHAWSALKVPLPFSVDELIYNPYTRSVAAVSGRALYRSPPGMEVFVLFASLNTDQVKVIPIPVGYVVFTNGREITLLDETNNRQETILMGNETPEPAFEPVAMDKIGALLYFVTADGRVYAYDTLRHRWEAPVDIPHRDVVDIRGVGYRILYQTGGGTLQVPGSFPVIGGGYAQIDDGGIRYATASARYLWIAGDRFIERYDQETHTWEASRRIDLGSDGPPSCMTPVEGRLAYRSGAEESTGALRVEGRLIDQAVGQVTTAMSALWYMKDQNLYRWDPRQSRPALAVDADGPTRLSGERILYAVESRNLIWMATQSRILTYDTNRRLWQTYPLPESQPVETMRATQTGVLVQSGGVFYEWSPGSRLWKRVSAPSDDETNISSRTSAGKDTVLIESPLWRWTLADGSVEVQFAEATLRDVSVFATDETRWRFRFDTVRGVSGALADLVTIHDGLLCRYTPQDTTLSLNGVHLSGGPAIPDAETVLMRRGADGAPYARVNAKWLRLEGINTIPRLIPYNGSDDPVAIEALIDDETWRWERQRSTGRLRKYRKTGDGLEEVRIRNGRFTFDDMTGFTVAGDNVWLATSGGVAHYSFTRSSFPIASLEYDTSIAGHDNPSIRRINVRDNTLYCEIEGQGVYARALTDREWRRPASRETPWLRQPVYTPFWTWTHDMTTRTVSGVYRDAGGQQRPVVWNAGMFPFDRVSDVVWHGDALWTSTEAGMAMYPKYRGFLDLDSLRLYTDYPAREGFVVVDEGRPAQAGLYIRGGNRLYRHDPETRRFEEETFTTPTDRLQYSGQDYMNDRHTQTILVDYNGFWRCRRRVEGRDTPQTPGVVIESRINGVWERIVMEDGRFGFDQLRDFAVDGEELWLATRSGLIRYNLGSDRLDLRRMTALGGDRYTDATDVMIRETAGGKRLTARRGRNNSAVFELDMATMTASSVSDNPFSRAPLVETPYWRWVKEEQYTGSVMTGYRLDLEFRSDRGRWTPLSIDERTGVFPFLNVRDLFTHDGALWTATPVGLFRYPADHPMNPGQAVFYHENEQLQQAGRMGLLPDGRLACSVGDGPVRRVYALDRRDRWEDTGANGGLETILFQEDQWTWRETERGVDIRYQDDTARPRPMYQGIFADHYFKSVASDKQTLWTLTPAGLIRYDRIEADTLRMRNWYTSGDFREAPELFTDLLPGGRTQSRSVFSLIHHRDNLWLFTVYGLIGFRVSDDAIALQYIGYIPLREQAFSVEDGHLFHEDDGTIRLLIRSGTDSRSTRQYLVDIEARRLVSVDMGPGATISDTMRTLLPPSERILSKGEDKRFLWLAAPEGIYRIDKKRRPR